MYKLLLLLLDVVGGGGWDGEQEGFRSTDIEESECQRGYRGYLYWSEVSPDQEILGLGLGAPSRMMRDQRPGRAWHTKKEKR